MLLALNGVRITATDEELFELTVSVAAGKLRAVARIAAQLEQWTAPLHD